MKRSSKLYDAGLAVYQLDAIARHIAWLFLVQTLNWKATIKQPVNMPISFEGFQTDELSRRSSLKIQYWRGELPEPSKLDTEDIKNFRALVEARFGKALAGEKFSYVRWSKATGKKVQSVVSKRRSPYGKEIRYLNQLLDEGHRRLLRMPAPEPLPEKDPLIASFLERLAILEKHLGWWRLAACAEYDPDNHVEASSEAEPNEMKFAHSDFQYRAESARKLLEERMSRARVLQVSSPTADDLAYVDAIESFVRQALTELATGGPSNCVVQGVDFVAKYSSTADFRYLEYLSNLDWDCCSAVIDVFSNLKILPARDQFIWLSEYGIEYSDFEEYGFV